MDHLVAPTIAENGLDFDGAPSRQGARVGRIVRDKTAPELPSVLAFHHHRIAALESSRDRLHAHGKQAFPGAQRAFGAGAALTFGLGFAFATLSVRATIAAKREGVTWGAWFVRVAGPLVAVAGLVSCPSRMGAVSLLVMLAPTVVIAWLLPGPRHLRRIGWALVGASALATVLLLAFVRPRWRGHSRRAWATVAAFGVALGMMNYTFYGSLGHLPIGVAVTIEFIGPLSLAAASMICSSVEATAP